MNRATSFCYSPIIVGIIAVVICSLFLSSCYSFRGSSVPPHLHTVSCATVVDNSNFGSSVYRELTSQLLVEKVRAENSFRLVERDGDARINVVLSEIRDEAISVKAGEIERERKVRVSLDCEYYDAVKKRQILKKTFSNAAVFVVANATTERDKAIRSALQQDIDDIMLAVVSGW